MTKDQAIGFERAAMTARSARHENSDDEYMVCVRTDTGAVIEFVDFDELAIYS